MICLKIRFVIEVRLCLESPVLWKGGGNISQSQSAGVLDTYLAMEQK